MALSLKEIRERLQKQINNIQDGNVQLDNSIYPFWNLQDGSMSEIRFLPDANEKNVFFWVEKLTIKLPFQGTINGQNNTNNLVYVSVPCMEMYGKKCPIQEEIRPMWKDDSLKETAKVYYKKRSYIFQGFVVKDGLDEQNPPENPIRKFMINVSLFKIIRDTLMDPDIEDLVIDFDKGRDFRIKKTKRGNYSDYSTSQFTLKSRALTKEEREAIQTYGLNDLSSFLPPEPNSKELNIIMDMFQASLEGEPYDYERWGDFYRPLGRSQTVLSQEAQEDETLGSIEKLNRVQRTVSKTSNLAREEDEEEESSTSVQTKTTVTSSVSQKKNPSSNTKDNVLKTLKSKTTEQKNEEEDEVDEETMEQTSKILDMIRKMRER